MITVEVTQYVAPNGFKCKRYAQVSDDCAVGYEALRRLGCRLTAEVLSTGHVSQCIEHEYGDYDIEITSHGTKVINALEGMIRRFDEADFVAWLDGAIEL